MNYKILFNLGMALAGTFIVPAFAQSTPASPVQSAVASKTAAFTTILPADPALSKALDAKDLPGAQKYVGKQGAFTGTVVKVYTAKDNGSVVLDFAAHYKEALTATLRPAQYALFPDMKTLEGKKVLVTGKFGAYQGRPQIDLLKPTQVQIIVPKP